MRRQISFLILFVFWSFTTNAQIEFTHVQIRVPDSAEAAQWYDSVFGSTSSYIGQNHIINHVNGYISVINNQGNIAPQSDQGVIDHFSIAVPDVAATVALVQSKGGVLKDGPRKGITAPVIAFIEDPWGVRMELVEDDEYPGINHLHLFTTDPDTMKDWLLNTFGGRYDSDRGQGIFHTIYYDKIWVHITKSRDGQRKASLGMAIEYLAFDVDSLDEFRTRLINSGYDPYSYTSEKPDTNTLRFDGPEGIHFVINEK
jgi:catechol 2,3-dioxygenase-like lactoylglutathione lyase family enzyme